MVVSRDAVNNEFIENYAFDPFHPDRDLQDAYYEAAHRGGCYAKNVYANKASKYMNIDITRGLKEIDNSLYIVEGEAFDIFINNLQYDNQYQASNPGLTSKTFEESFNNTVLDSKYGQDTLAGVIIKNINSKISGA